MLQATGRIARTVFLSLKTTNLVIMVVLLYNFAATVNLNLTVFLPMQQDSILPIQQDSIKIR